MPTLATDLDRRLRMLKFDHLNHQPNTTKRKVEGWLFDIPDAYTPLEDSTAPERRCSAESFEESSLEHTNSQEHDLLTPPSSGPAKAVGKDEEEGSDWETESERSEGFHFGQLRLRPSGTKRHLSALGASNERSLEGKYPRPVTFKTYSPYEKDEPTRGSNSATGFFSGKPEILHASDTKIEAQLGTAEDMETFYVGVNWGEP